jgi:glycosyltransferase involved in cell wall biosynthesis
MWKGKKVSVVFSTFSDVDTIRECIDGFIKTGVVDEVVAVDNNAVEGTKEEIEKTRARRVVEPRQGLGYGYKRALDEATGDIIITTEVDGTYDPKDIMKLLAYSDDFDVVCGTRTASFMIREGADMGFSTRWANVVYAKFIEILFNTSNLTDVGCIYRLTSKRAWDKIKHSKMDTGWAFNLDWMLFVIRNKIKYVEVPVNFLPRVGESVGAAQSTWKAAKIAIRMMGFIVRHRFNIIKKK